MTYLRIIYTQSSEKDVRELVFAPQDAFMVYTPHFNQLQINTMNTGWIINMTPPQYEKLLVILTLQEEKTMIVLDLNEVVNE